SCVRYHCACVGVQFLDCRPWLDWLCIGDLEPGGPLHFNQYEQMIQAAISGQGVPLGRQPLVNDLLQSGALVTPFRKAVVGSRAYFIIESEHSAAKPHVRQFAAWLLEEAKGSA